MSALNDGPVLSVAGTLNQGVLPSGITSMLNGADAEAGTFDETDEEYRIGLGTRLAALGAGTVVSIKAALLTVPNVTTVSVFENDTSVTDSIGLPPHSINALVEGGVAQDIWDVLGIKKGAGTYTDGDQVGTYTDPIDGQTFPMRYTIPTVIDIYVTVEVTSKDSNYPATGDQDIEDAILAEGALFEPGDDVVLPRLQSAVTSVPGILAYTLFFDDAITPTTDTAIVITAFQKADFDSTRTIVTS